MFWAKMWDKVPKSGLIALGCLVFYAVIRYSSFYDDGILQPFLKILWVVPFSYALIWFGYSAPRFFNTITHKIGDLSYGIYIWHMVVINYFIYFNILEKVSNLNSNLIHLLVIIITVVIAIFSWNFIEKQALKLKPYTSRIVKENAKTKQIV